MQRRLAGFKYLFERGRIKDVKVETGESGAKLAETLDLLKLLV